jgi:N-acetylmuramoyl-L-alanine amidase
MGLPRGATWVVRCVAATVLAWGLAACGSSQKHSTASAAATTSTSSPAALTTSTSNGSAAATTTTTSSTARHRPRHRRAPAHARAHAAGNAVGVPPPRIVADPIPYGPQRLAEMRAYAERHYGRNTYRLIDPHVIVIHFTDTPDFRSTYNTFAPDVPDVELHELPGVCSHFVIDRDGTTYQLVPLDIMCRHTVGLNYTAIGVEQVGFTDAEIMNNPRQLDASLTLVRWLRCRFHISVANVIGHNESLSSPYHHENVAALRTQTHDDFRRADMDVYRARLAALGGCPG